MYKCINTCYDFEFYYLVELTRQKVKPLSRWEKPLPDRLYYWLQQQDLHTAIVPRKTWHGRTVNEIIFSTSMRYLDLYQRKFAGNTLSNSKATQELEGFLFGYPACCVRQFIQHPYIPNNLPRDKQSLLFHWACPDCRSTQDLLPYYNSFYLSAQANYNAEFSKLRRSRSYRRALQKMLALILISGSTVSAQIISDSRHYIPLPNDTNQNGLTYAEEVYLGTYYYGFDTENCERFAKLFSAIIDSLPSSVQTDQTYVNHWMARGVIKCPCCGMNINMGYLEIVNPMRQLSINIPYMGLHFMKNGFFTYSTDDPDQRIDLDRLRKILYPVDRHHLLPTDEDKDGDGLKDSEEDSLWINYTADNPDFNGDGVPDGVQIAEELIRLFPKLKEQKDNIHTSINFVPVWGSETCQICGSVHNMGYIQFSNPENKRTYQIPYISLHALAHGSFVHNGTVHTNQRTDPIELYRVMKTHMLFISNDSDNDGLTDEEEVYFGFDPANPDSNGDGICDGMETAIILAEMVRSLPSEPSETEPYAEFLGMDGIQLCSVCGREIPMGVTQIYNPQLRDVSAPLEISEYAFHFLEKGSFACEGEENNRIDPILLAKFVGKPALVDHDMTAGIIKNFELKQNYPNPFNPVTNIVYTIREKTIISLKVYDIRGQKITTLVDEVQPPGTKTVIWDGTDSNGRTVNSGLYIYTCTAGKASQSRKMLFLK